MSECVVRMEVPENCYECDMFMSMFVNDCPIYQKPGGQGNKHKYTSSRHPDCPIICSLPEGHGRLVDMRDIDSMMEDALSTSDESGLYSLVYRDDLDFDGLPTIVPAERSGDK